MSTPPIILIVDDDSSHRAMLRTVLRGWGYATDEADDGDTAVEKVKERAYDAVLSDVRMARMDGISAIREILHHNPSIPVLVMTAWQSVETAVAALRLGAYDYLEKPLDFDLLHLTLERALDHTRLAAENRELREYIRESPSGLLGRSPRMRELIEMVNTVAPTEATVLITGESGTGKERVARAIQEASARRGKAFVTVNCAALNESLLESELFGHEKGAFTGAHTTRRGYFEQANGGTLFLDEIGEMPQEAQVHLLRVLESRYVTRVGDHRPIPVDVRVIAATQTDLMKKVREGTFRKDLWFRLAVLTIVIPPLRDRKADIPALVGHFLRTKAAQFEMEVPDVPAPELERLYSHDWPGNVRELEFVIERSLLLSRSKAVGTPLKFEFAPEVEGGAASPEDGWPSLAELEQRYIRRVLEKTGNKLMGPGSATELLGVHYTTLRAHMLKMGLPLPRRK